MIDQKTKVPIKKNKKKYVIIPTPSPPTHSHSPAFSIWEPQSDKCFQSKMVFVYTNLKQILLSCHEVMIKVLMLMPPNFHQKKAPVSRYNSMEFSVIQ